MRSTLGLNKTPRTASTGASQKGLFVRVSGVITLSMKSRRRIFILRWYSWVREFLNFIEHRLFTRWSFARNFSFRSKLSVDRCISPAISCWLSSLTCQQRTHMAWFATTEWINRFYLIRIPPFLCNFQDLQNAGDNLNFTKIIAANEMSHKQSVHGFLFAWSNSGRICWFFFKDVSPSHILSLFNDGSTLNISKPRLTVSLKFLTVKT